MVSSTPKPLGSLKLHPLTHLALILCSIAIVDRFAALLPLDALPLLFVRAIVLALGLGIYWGIVQNRHPLQKRCGSLNLRLLEIGTIALWCWGGGDLVGYSQPRD